MKCALVYPEMYEYSKFGTARREFPPFGVLYLASVLEGLGDEVEIYSVDKDVTSFDFTNFDAVGFSISASCAYNIFKKMREDSNFSEKSVLFSGGIHTTLFPEYVIDDLKMDVVFIGESEESIVEFSKAINSNEPYDSIKGTLAMKNGRLIANEKAEQISDIDSIPFPSRHLLDKEKIVMGNRLAKTNLKIAHIMASRGCAYNCYFCANQYKNVRYRSAKNIRKELISLKTDYAIEGFCITDDNFIIDEKKVSEICTEISDLSLKWSALSRVDTITSNLLSILKKSGCIELKFGVESGSEELLRKMNKKITQEQIKDAIIKTKSEGIGVKIFLIHGFPGENMKTTEETIKLIDSLKNYIDRVSLFRFVPLPGSYVYNNPKKFALKNIDLFDNLYIYNEDTHWWGEASDYMEVQESYVKLENYIKDIWG